MTAEDQLRRICEGLAQRGEPGSLNQVARLLDVAPSTVSRWSSGETTPTARQQERLTLLYRTVCEAEKGNQDADQILGALLGAAGAGLLGLGMGGILIAAGLGWLMGDERKGKKSGNDDESKS